MGKTIAAGIFIVRKDKRLLICHPTNHKPDFWSIPKGKAEEGETMWEAASRETFEETNINFELLNKDNWTIHELDGVTYGHKKKMIYPFLCLETNESDLSWNDIEIKCNSNVPVDRGGFPEMDDYKWVSIEEARPLIHETQAACLDKITQIIMLDISAVSE